MDSTDQSEQPTGGAPSALRRLLDAFGVRQNELAARLGVGRSVINNWCTIGVPADRISEICDALELDPEQSARFARDAGHPLPSSVERVVIGDESVNSDVIEACHA